MPTSTSMITIGNIYMKGTCQNEMSKENIWSIDQSLKIIAETNRY